MRIKYCHRYSNYVSKQHCEFFNEGHNCGQAGQGQWSSIKNLLQDRTRPQREVNAILKPFQCDLMQQRVPGSLNNGHAYGVQAV